MKSLILGIVLFAIVNIKAEEDPHSQDGDNGAQKGRKFNMPGGAIDKEEFKKNFRDLLGPAWTNLDMEGLDFYILPMLNYSLSDLEPYFTTEQVHYHWEGNNEQTRLELNSVLKEWRKEEPDNAFSRKSLIHMIENVDWVPTNFYDRFHKSASSYLMHSLYFGVLSPNFGAEMRYPVGKVAYGIEKNFRDFNNFRAKFNINAGKQHGSGFTCLVKRPNGLLKIENYPDAYSPLISGGYPLLVLDLWEHAWYLKHKHNRTKYVEDWWMLINWEQVEALNDYWDTYDAKKQELKAEKKRQKEAKEAAEAQKEEEQKEEL